METTNGYANGYSKGPKMNGLNGHAVGTKGRSSTARRPTLFSRLFSIIARLLTWYSVVTLLFRCPATLELCDETTPKICKPYFQAKHAFAPHLEPYYDAYAAPYVDVARPYYDIANEKVVLPAKGYATKYGGPALAHAQAFGQSQWDQRVQPQLAVYQKLAQDQYDEKVAPHVTKASVTMAPYFEIAKTNALQTYHEFIWPSYQFAQPYLAQTYDISSRFATDTAIPSLFWTWNKTNAFLDSTVWPQLRVLYVQNVEPQLALIGQRLGRYGEKSKAAAENVSESIESVTSPSSFSKPSSSVQASVSSIVSKATEAAPIPDPEEIAKQDESERVIPPPHGVETPDAGKTAQEIVAEDLEQWQTKFAKAADEGASEIETRIDDIAKEMISENVNKVGKPLVAGLEDTVNAQYDVLKQEIITIVQESGPSAGDNLISAVRKAGLAVKEKAQTVRTWKVSFENEMEVAITKAAENHFKILESIRDLALQRIGMKWAWMDGVTYKDWAKFHELKDKFDEWTNDLKRLIVTHPALDDTREASAAVEDAAMGVAQDAAQELARLKQVGLWKLAAADTSDDFASESTRQAAEAAEQAKIEAAEKAKAEAAERAAAEAAEAARAAEAAKAAEQVSEPEEDPLEEAVHEIEDESPATDLPEKADDGVSEPEQDPLESAAHVLEDDSPADDLPHKDSVISGAESAATRLAEDFSSASDSASSAAEDFVSAASDSVTSIAAKVSSLAGDDLNTAESVDNLASTIIEGDDHTFVVNDTGKTPADDESQQPLSPEQKAEQKLEDQLEEEIIPESVEDESVEAETPKVKPAFLGAMAQEVPNRGGPILDEDTEENLDTYSQKAQEAYANAVAQASHRYSIAMSAVSAQLYGTPEPEPVQEHIFAGISSRYAAATEAANARLKDALDAASKGVYGDATPTPTPSFDWNQVEAMAAKRLTEGRIWAEEQYEAAKIALGLATATPTASSEKLLNQAKANYYAGLGNAQARYQEFLEAAAAALNTFTAAPTPTDVAGTASSVASVASDSAGALASGASVDGLHVASVVGDGFNAAASVVNEAVHNAAQEVMDAAEAVERGVTETWENVVAQISAQIYGVPTPTAWYDNAYHGAGDYAAQASQKAAKQYEVVYSIVQELIAGKEPTFSESVLSRLQGAYATGASSAAAYYSQATDAAGDAREKANAAAAAAADAIRQNVQGGRDEL